MSINELTHGYIYVITNIVTNQKYVGKTSSRYPLRYIHTNYVVGFGCGRKKISLALQDFGIDCFTIEIMSDISKNELELLLLEDKYIDIHNSIENGYNCIKNFTKSPFELFPSKPYQKTKLVHVKSEEKSHPKTIRAIADRIKNKSEARDIIDKFIVVDDNSITTAKDIKSLFRYFGLGCVTASFVANYFNKKTATIRINGKQCRSIKGLKILDALKSDLIKL